MKTIPLERLIFSVRLARCRYRKETSHGETEEEEAGENGSDFANIETQRSGYRYGSDGSGGRGACGSRF